MLTKKKHFIRRNYSTKQSNYSVEETKIRYYEAKVNPQTIINCRESFNQLMHELKPTTHYTDTEESCVILSPRPEH